MTVSFYAHNVLLHFAARPLRSPAGEHSAASVQLRCLFVLFFCCFVPTVNIKPTCGKSVAEL